MPLGVLGFVLPLVLLNTLKARLDPTFQLPLQNQYLLLHGLTGVFAVVFSTLIGLPLQAQARVAQRPARVKRSPARR